MNIKKNYSHKKGDKLSNILDILKQVNFHNILIKKSLKVSYHNTGYNTNFNSRKKCFAS